MIALGAIISVWPSGAALRSVLAPMMPPAPGLFSTRIGLPQTGSSF
jgi:hypothetical protein